MSDYGLAADAVKEIERLVLDREPKEVLIGGQAYATSAVVDPRKRDPEPAALEFNTLQGFVEFAKSVDAKVFAHIESPTSVILRSVELAGHFRQRTMYAVANAITPDFQFGYYCSAESFAIALLSQFEPTEDRDRVFEITGTVEAGSSIKTADDGVSQLVTTRAGIDRKLQEVGPGKLYHLRPYATFSEIDQPERPMVLRMRAGSADPPKPHSCALFEADGGLWRLAAIKSLREWLTAELGDAIPVHG